MPLNTNTQCWGQTGSSTVRLCGKQRKCLWADHAAWTASNVSFWFNKLCEKSLIKSLSNFFSLSIFFTLSLSLTFLFIPLCWKFWFWFVHDLGGLHFMTSFWTVWTVKEVCLGNLSRSYCCIHLQYLLPMTQMQIKTWHWGVKLIKE